MTLGIVSGERCEMSLLLLRCQLRLSWFVGTSCCVFCSVCSLVGALVVLLMLLLCQSPRCHLQRLSLCYQELSCDAVGAIGDSLPVFRAFRCDCPLPLSSMRVCVSRNVRCLLVLNEMVCLFCVVKCLFGEPHVDLCGSFMHELVSDVRAV